MTAISTVIIAQNEEANVAAAVRSARPFSDEVLVVDGGSIDRTREVAIAAGARVALRTWSGFAQQRNYAASIAAHDWIFWLDCDERVPPELAREILDAKPHLAASRVYRVSRVGEFMGTRMLKEYHPRLYNRTKTSFRDDAVHERIETANLRIEDFGGSIDHFGYGSFSQLMQKFSRYAELDAENQRRSGRRFHCGYFLYRTLGKLAKMYIGHGLFLKGRAGIFCALAFAIYEVEIAAALIDAERVAVDATPHWHAQAK